MMAPSRGCQVGACLLFASLSAARPLERVPGELIAERVFGEVIAETGDIGMTLQDGYAQLVDDLSEGADEPRPPANPQLARAAFAHAAMQVASADAAHLIYLLFPQYKTVSVPRLAESARFGISLLHRGPWWPHLTVREVTGGSSAARVGGGAIVPGVGVMAVDEEPLHDPHRLREVLSEMRFENAPHKLTLKLPLRGAAAATAAADRTYGSCVAVRYEHDVIRRPAGLATRASPAQPPRLAAVGVGLKDCAIDATATVAADDDTPAASDGPLEVYARAVRGVRNDIGRALTHDAAVLLIATHAARGGAAHEYRQEHAYIANVLGGAYEREHGGGGGASSTSKAALAEAYLRLAELCAVADAAKARTGWPHLMLDKLIARERARADAPTVALHDAFVADPTLASMASAKLRTPLLSLFAFDANPVSAAASLRDGDARPGPPQAAADVAEALEAARAEGLLRLWAAGSAAATAEAGALAKATQRRRLHGGSARAAPVHASRPAERATAAAAASAAARKAETETLRGLVSTYELPATLLDGAPRPPGLVLAGGTTAAHEAAQPSLPTLSAMSAVLRAKGTHAIKKASAGAGSLGRGLLRRLGRAARRSEGGDEEPPPAASAEGALYERFSARYFLFCWLPANLPAALAPNERFGGEVFTGAFFTDAPPPLTPSIVDCLLDDATRGACHECGEQRSSPAQHDEGGLDAPAADRR